MLKTAASHTISLVCHESGPIIFVLYQNQTFVSMFAYFLTWTKPVTKSQFFLGGAFSAKSIGKDVMFWIKGMGSKTRLKKKNIQTIDIITDG